MISPVMDEVKPTFQRHTVFFFFFFFFTIRTEVRNQVN
jgi:hypothetical protein